MLSECTTSVTCVTDAMMPEGGRDSSLDAVADVLRAADPDGVRFARALRRTLDMLLDGQHTGRYRWDQLHKTEKTHAGTLVEINLQREFDFDDGERLDYRIAGADVDCKFSQRRGGWMIPPEAVGQLCLLVWANDERSRWCAGLVRADAKVLNPGTNRDAKRTLSPVGRDRVQWLFEDAELPENALLALSESDVEAVFAPSSGQGRVDELFRRAQQRLVSRAVVATVAQQEDYMKRVRGNGGSRSRLRSEGFVILGQYGIHQDIARRLGLPVPGPGESVSARLTPWDPARPDTPSVELDGRRWMLASPGDAAVEAPTLPRV